MSTVSDVRDMALEMGLSSLVHVNLNPLARISAIYFLLKDGEVVYVGQSVSVFDRLLSHLNEMRSEAAKDFDSTSFIPVPKDRLDELEQLFIRVLRPKYNRAHNPDCPPQPSRNGETQTVEKTTIDVLKAHGPMCGDHVVQRVRRLHFFKSDASLRSRVRKVLGSEMVSYCHDTGLYSAP